MALKSARAARSVWGEGVADWRATRNSANSSTSDSDSTTTGKIIEHRCRGLEPSGKRRPPPGRRPRLQATLRTKEGRRVPAGVRRPSRALGETSPLDELGCGVGRCRAGEVIPLSVATAEVGELPCLLDCLDALCHCGHAEVAG